MIYIGLPSESFKNISDDVKRKFAVSLAESLKKYYATPIEVRIHSQNNEPKAVVRVMECAKFSNLNENIRSEITECIRGYLAIDAKVLLEYSKVDENFKPRAVAAKDHVDNRGSATSNIEPKNLNNRKSEEFDYEKLSYNYQSEKPRFSFEQVILPEKTITQIIEAVSIIEVENKVFDEWGLRSIIPTATSAISFFGAPGTGKTMAAEAIAQKLGKKILKATYADIESKYHGEGPKMVKAIFRSAERDNAILFLDESDSLLSKRLTNVSDGSSQAINSMRSQLLISLENFRGIVIFATNLVINYDKAFLSRLINIEFPHPDAECRAKIWKQHLIGGANSQLHIPLSDDIDINSLARDYNFSGREIKNSVKNACVTVAIAKRNCVMQDDLVSACEKTKEGTTRVLQTSDHTKSSLDDSQSGALKKAIQHKLNENVNSMA